MKKMRLKLDALKKIKNIKITKRNMSKALKCLLVFMMLASPFMSITVAFAEHAQITGRSVNLNRPTAIRELDVPERIALTADELEFLRETSGTLNNLTFEQRESLTAEILESLILSDNLEWAEFSVERQAVIISMFMEINDNVVQFEPPINELYEVEYPTTENWDYEDDEYEINTPDLRLPLLPFVEPNSEGELIDVGRYYRTYSLGNGQFETILFSEPQTFTEVVGFGPHMLGIDTYAFKVEVEQEIDNNLVRGRRGGRRYRRNRGNDIETVIPEILYDGEGVEFITENVAMEIIPLFGDFDRLATLENAALYNDVITGIDVQYTVNYSSLSQEIILNHLVETNEFEFMLDLPDYQMFRMTNGAINIYENGVRVQDVMPPILTDGNGHATVANVRWETDNETITIVVDEDFLNDPQTVFPIRVETLFGGNVSANAIGMYSVQEGTFPRHLVIGDNGSPYTGYDDGIVSGNLPNFNNAHLNTRTYVRVPQTLFDNIPAAMREYGVTVASAEFAVSQRTTMGNSVPNRRAEFTLSTPDVPWTGNITWDAQIGMSHIVRGERQSARTVANAFISWDVRATVMEWMMTPSSNNGFVLRAFEESSRSQAEVWNSRSNLARISFTWEIPDPVDPNFPLAGITTNVHPVIERNFANNVQRVRGVFATGLATPMAQIQYFLLDPSGMQVGQTQAVGGSFSRRFPDTRIFGTGTNGLNNSSRQIIERDHNWQTGRFFRTLVPNTPYQFGAIAHLGGNNSPAATSDTFLIYHATRMDLLPRIARHYGVDLDQLMIENQVQDALSTAGLTLFLRNPRTFEPFNYPPRTGNDRWLIDATNKGRGGYGMYGLDPVNLLTGNFFKEAEDVTMDTIGGEFSLFRTFNTFSQGANGMFGRGWTFDFNRFINMDEDGNILYFKGDGSVGRFMRQGTNSWTPPNGYNYSLRRVQIGTNEEEEPRFRWEITDDEGSIIRFNSWGMMYAIENVYGFTTRIYHDRNFNIERIVAPCNATFQFTTNNRGQVTQIRLPNGGILRYEYDEHDRLIRFTNAGGGVTRYYFDDLHRMTRFYDATNTRILYNTYDSRDRLIRQVDANGNVATLEFSNGRTVKTDNEGNRFTYEFDNLYRVTRVVNPDGSVDTKSYDANNRQTTAVDENRNPVTRGFDNNHRMISETRADGRTRRWTYNSRNQVVTYTDFYGRVTTNVYNANGHLIEIRFPDNTTHQMQRDSLGNMTRFTDAMGFHTYYTFDGHLKRSRTDSLGHTTWFYHNALNQLTATRDPYGNISRYTFDLNGELISRTAPDGGVTRYNRNAAGQVESITDARGHTTTFQFDGMAQVTRATNALSGRVDFELDRNGRVVAENDESGFITRFIYDDNGRLIEEANPEGGRIRFRYDGRDNVTLIIDELGGETQFGFDNLGRNTRITDRYGQVTTRTYGIGGVVTQVVTPIGTRTYRYDVMNRREGSTDENGVVTTYTRNRNGEITSRNVGGRITNYQLDRLGQVTRVRNPRGYYRHYTYDRVGNRTSITNERGYRTDFRFDAMGREIETIEPNNRRTSRVFDLNGNLTRETDARGNVTTHSFNALNLLTSTTDPYGRVTHFTYTANEELATIRDARNLTTRFYRDGNGNILRTVDHVGNTWTKTYDVAGNLLTERTPDGFTTRFYYNRLNQRTRSVDTFGQMTTFIYDNRNNNTRIDMPTGSIINEFDNLNRMSATTNEFGVRTTFTYDRTDNVITENEGGRITRSYYDAIGQLVQSTNPRGYTRLYVYDRNGNITRVTNERGHATNFIYDRLDRRIRETNHYGHFSTREYNAAGNMIRKRDWNGNFTTHYYNNANRRIATTNPLGFTTQMTYHPNGLLHHVTDPYGAVTTHQYDRRGNVTRVTNALNHFVEFRYDALGNLTHEIDESGNTTVFVYNQHGL